MIRLLTMIMLIHLIFPCLYLYSPTVGQPTGGWVREGFTPMLMFNCTKLLKRKKNTCNKQGYVLQPSIAVDDLALPESQAQQVLLALEPTAARSPNPSAVQESRHRLVEGLLMHSTVAVTPLVVL